MFRFTETRTNLHFCDVSEANDLAAALPVKERLYRARRDRPRALHVSRMNSGCRQKPSSGQSVVTVRSAPALPCKDSHELAAVQDHYRARRSNSRGDGAAVYSSARARLEAVTP